MCKNYWRVIEVVIKCALSAWLNISSKCCYLRNKQETVQKSVILSSDGSISRLDCVIVKEMYSLKDGCGVGVSGRCRPKGREGTCK